MLRYKRSLTVDTESEKNAFVTCFLIHLARCVRKKERERRRDQESTNGRFCSMIIPARTMLYISLLACSITSEMEREKLSRLANYFANGREGSISQHSGSNFGTVVNIVYICLTNRTITYNDKSN